MLRSNSSKVILFQRFTSMSNGRGLSWPEGCSVWSWHTALQGHCCPSLQVHLEWASPHPPGTLVVCLLIGAAINPLLGRRVMCWLHFLIPQMRHYHAVIKAYLKTVWLDGFIGSLKDLHSSVKEPSGL